MSGQEGNATTVTKGSVSTGNTSTGSGNGFVTPKLYDLSAVHNKMLGTHKVSSSSGTSDAANLTVSDFS